MLTAIVITKNEENLIKTCLESLKFADEIIVVDNGSVDATAQIAKRYTEKIIKIESDDFSKIRNLGMEKAKGDWVLYIDSDERVLIPLKEEINQIISAENKYSAYAIPRKNIIFGQEVSYGPYKHDFVIRLLRKKDFEGWVGRVHEYPKFKGKLGYTKNSLLHLTHRNIDRFILKSLDWSKIDAKLRLEAGHPKMSWWRFIRIFISELFYQGVARKGFFSGTVGIIDSMLQVFSMYITYVRLWQMQQKSDLDQLYKDIDKKLEEDKFNY